MALSQKQYTNFGRTQIATSGDLNNTTNPKTLNVDDGSVFATIANGQRVVISSTTDPMNDTSREIAEITARTVNSITLSRPNAVAHTGKSYVFNTILAADLTDLGAAVTAVEASVAAAPKASYDAIVATSGGDYTTLAAALTAGKRSIYIRNGTYAEGTLSSTWTGTVPINVVGESMAGVVLQLGSSASNSWFKLNINGSQLSNLTIREGTVSKSSADEGWISIEATDCVFTNVTIIGTSSYSYANGAALWISSSGNKFRMFGGGFKNINSPGAVRFGFVQDSLFESCDFDSCEGNEFTATINMLRLRVIGCRFYYQDTGLRQTDILTSTVTNTYEKLQFIDNSINFNTSQTNRIIINLYGARDNNVISNNTVLMSGGYGTFIRASDVRNDHLVIADNIIATTATSGSDVLYVAGAMDNPQVRGNKIFFSGTSRANYGAILLDNAIGGSCFDNSIRGFNHATGNYAISLGGSTDVWLGQNEINDCSVHYTGISASTTTRWTQWSSVASKTGAYTITELDSIITGNATGAAFTITLPTASGHCGKQYTIKKTDASANVVTIGTTSSQTIDGSTTVALSTQYASRTVVSDGTNWQVIATV